MFHLFIGEVRAKCGSCFLVCRFVRIGFYRATFLICGSFYIFSWMN